MRKAGDSVESCGKLAATEICGRKMTQCCGLGSAVGQESLWAVVHEDSHADAIVDES